VKLSVVKGPIRRAAVVVATVVFVAAGFASPSSASSSSASSSTRPGHTLARPAAGAVAGTATAASGWTLYTVASTPMLCDYYGWLGYSEHLWRDFYCWGFGVTPIGPGTYYLFVLY
jgi:hypothetical protein